MSGLKQRSNYVKSRCPRKGSVSLTPREQRMAGLRPASARKWFFPLAARVTAYKLPLRPPEALARFASAL